MIETGNIDVKSDIDDDQMMMMMMMMMGGDDGDSSSPKEGKHMQHGDKM